MWCTLVKMIWCVRGAEDVNRKLEKIMGKAFGDVHNSAQD